LKFFQEENLRIAIPGPKHYIGRLPGAFAPFFRTTKIRPISKAG